MLTTTQDPVAFASVRHLTVRREGRVLLGPLNFDFPAGSYWTILGPNGAGKSTLLHCLAGWLWPSTGQVRIFGKEPGDEGMAKWQQNIGYFQPLQQEGQLQRHLTCAEILVAGARGTIGLYPAPKAAELEAARSFLDQYRLGDWATRQFQTLSSGEKRRLLFLRATLRRPPLLLLDEPFVSLDFRNRENLIAALQEYIDTARPAGVLCVTHHWEEILPAMTHIAWLEAGRISHWGTKKDMSNPDNIKALFGPGVRLENAGDRAWLMPGKST